MARTKLNQSTLRDLATAFYRGDHLQVIRETLDNPAWQKKMRGLAFVIGSLAFLGRVEEAEGLRATHASRFSVNDRSAILFFLGMAYCRLSDYSRAKRYFAENLWSSRRNPSTVVKFFSWQGLGLFRFFGCRYNKALRAAQSASALALQGNYLWGRLISTDLVGHSLVQLGQVQNGLHNLERARTYAEDLGHGGNARAIEVALVCFRAQFGLNPEGSIEEIKLLMQRLNSNDTYSQASVYLELARQYYLRGKMRLAREALNHSCRYVFGLRSRRQSVQLNLRYGQLHFLEGEFEQALNLSQNALRETVSGIDLALEVEALGLQEKILSAMQPTHESLHGARIQELTELSQKGTALRILARQGKKLMAGFGQDRMADFIDGIKGHQRSEESSSTAWEQVIDSGYLVFLRELCNVTPKEKVLWLDGTKGGLAIFDPHFVHWVDKGLSPTFRKILVSLGRHRQLSKEKLIGEIWGYKYRMQDHDSLIYSTMSRLRHLLGEAGAWIEATEDGYNLQSDVEVRGSLTWAMNDTEILESTGKTTDTIVANATGKSQAYLNHRQIMILKYLRKSNFINVQQCLLEFAVSEITASRDLSQLHKLGRVERVGRGRATHYRLTSKEL